MTYKSASSWADNNIPKDEFDEFSDWYEQAINELGSAIETDKNGNPTEFKDLMKAKWLEEVGSLTRENEPEPEPIDEQSQITELPEIPEEITDIRKAREELRRDQQLQADSTIRELEQIQKGEQEQTQQQSQQLQEAQQMEQFRRQVEQSRQELQREGVIPKPSFTQRFSSGISKFASRLGGLFRRNKK